MKDGAIVVTGAGSGMGLACAGRLRGMGSVLIAADLTAPQVEGAHGLACDVSDPRAVDALAGLVRDAGGLRALVHAAGISPTMGDARSVFRVNLVGTQLLVDALTPMVSEGSAGVLFSSSAAHMVAPFVTPEQEALLADPLAAAFLDTAVSQVQDSGYAYSLSKHGVIRSAERAAVVWGAVGARVNSLSPGLIDTPMGRKEMAEQPVMEQMLQDTPLQRQAQADEVAAVVAFLVSDEASYVNGVDVLVDGGHRAAQRSGLPA